MPYNCTVAGHWQEIAFIGGTNPNIFGFSSKFSKVCSNTSVNMDMTGLGSKTKNPNSTHEEERSNPNSDSLSPQKTGDTDVALSGDNREDSAGLERRENIERAEKFSKLERRLQELSLGLQNLHDDLESVQLNSNMYYSNVIEYLDN